MAATSGATPGPQDEFDRYLKLEESTKEFTTSEHKQRLKDARILLWLAAVVILAGLFVIIWDVTTNSQHDLTAKAAVGVLMDLIGAFIGKLYTTHYAQLAKEREQRESIAAIWSISNKDQRDKALEEYRKSIAGKTSIWKRLFGGS